MELKKFKLIYDKDVEQEWLNEMCQHGWAMKHFCMGMYTFESCQPGEYIYQVDLLPGKGFTPDDPNGYAEFMEETGVEVVSRWFRWVTLRKKATDGPFEIYSDAESQIQLYSRIRTMFLWALGIELCCSASVWTNLHWGNPVIYAVALLYIAIFVALVRTVLKCNSKIKELEAGQ